MRFLLLSIVISQTAASVADAQEATNFTASGRLSFWYSNDQFYPFSPPFIRSENGSVSLDISLAAWTQMQSGLGFGGQVNLEDFGEPSKGDVDAFGYLYGTNWSTSLGNSDDAYDFALDEIGVGDTAGENAKLAWLDAGDNSGLLFAAADPVVLRQTLSAGDFDFALSAARISSDDRNSSADMDFVYAVGLRWDRSTAFGDFHVGVAFQQADADGNFGPETFFRRGIQAGWNWKDFNVNFIKSEGPVFEPGGSIYDSDYTGVSIGFVRNGWSLGANYGRQETSSCSAFDGQGIGAWFERDLSHGFKLTASHGNSKYFCGGKRFRESSIGVVKTF